MIRRAVLPVLLSLALTASVLAVHVQGAVPLTVEIAQIEMIAPGRVRVDATVGGLDQALHPTMVASVTVNGESVEGSPFPATASRIPMVIDLPAGRVRVGGDASVAEFAPVPPLREDLPIGFAVTVRQGDQTVTARENGVLRLPTVIVPGFMNKLGGVDTAAMAVLEQRGYRSTGTSPNLFWFTYPSRSLDLEAAAHALTSFVRGEVLPKAYAGRINVVGYSLGGLVTRWSLVFEPGWDHLVSRFVMVGVPNEGVVMPYVYSRYALTAPLAETPAARDLFPTFPFWRGAPGAPWGFPSEVRNRQLDMLNEHPLPEGIRIYAVYGNRSLDPDGRGTWAGVTGNPPKAGFAYAPGDGIVLTASVLGLPINGGAGVPGFADRLVKVDLGPIGHMPLLRMAMPRITQALVEGASVDRAVDQHPAQPRGALRFLTDPLAAGNPDHHPAGLVHKWADGTR